MLLRLIVTVIVLWAMFTFTPQILAGLAQLGGLVMDHVEISVS